MLPVRQLSAPAGSVVVPAFSRIQSDKERFARYYLRTMNLIVWIAAPVFGFLFVASGPVIALVLGTQWKAAAPVFQILAISAVGQLLLESTVWLFVSQGHSDRLLRLMLILCPIIVASFAVGLPFGIKGVALSGSLVLLAVLPWILKFSFRGTALTLRDLGLAILHPISMSLAGIILAELALRLVAPTSLLFQLLVDAIGFTVAYLLSALIPSVRAEFMSLGKLLRELRPSEQLTQPVA
jgi:O-antigen/teichoic acid export membrane protein